MYVYECGCLNVTLKESHLCICLFGDVVIEVFLSFGWNCGKFKSPLSCIQMTLGLQFVKLCDWKGNGFEMQCFPFDTDVCAQI